MINTDKLWIPSNVPSIRIKFCCKTCFSGGTPSTKNEKYWSDDGNGIPWIASGKLHDCFIDTPTDYITEKGLLNSSTKLVPKGSPLLAMTGATCSNAGLLKIEACTNQSVFAYVLNDRYDSLFTYYSLIAARECILLNQVGGAQAGINGEVCKNIYIPNFDLEKQKRIGIFLNNKVSSIDELISKEEEIIKKLEDYKFSLITKVVLTGVEKTDLKETGIDWMPSIPKHWSVTKIGSNCYLKGRIGWQGLTADEYKEAGPYLITGTDFENGRINWDTCVHITEKRYVEASHIRIKNGDVLITKDGTVGKVAIVENMPDKASLNSGVMLMRNTKGQYENKYLYYVLSSDIFWNWFYSARKENSTIIHLYQEQFEKFSFPLPPKEEQLEISNYLDKKCDAIDGLIKLKKEKIGKLKDYKISLINECVLGKKVD